MKKTLIILFIIGASFFGVNLVQATIIQQPIYDTSFTGTGAQMVNINQYFISPPETLTSSTISQIALKFTPDNTCSWKLKIFNTGASSYNSEPLVITAGDSGYHIFNFVTSSFFTTGNLARWQLDSGSTTPCNLTSQFSGTMWGSATTSSYPNGYTSGSGSVKNEYFTINGDPSGSFASTIAFSSTASSTCDFELWPLIVNLNNTDIAACEYTDCALAVRFNSSPVLIFSDWFYSFGTALQYGTQPVTMPQAITIPKSLLLDPGYVVYAQAVLYNNSHDGSVYEHDIWASSTVWEFIIPPGCSSTGSPATYPQATIGVWQPTVTSTNAGDNLTCDPADSWYQKGLCNFWNYLLKPDPMVLNNWVNLKTELQNKPPFGYVTTYISTTLNLTTSTATTSVDFGFLSKISFFDTLKTLLTWILWLTFGIWVINRLRNLSLHG